MHLPDGVVSGQLSTIGYLVSFLISVLSMGKKNLARELAKISLVIAVLFVASIITIPLGYTTVHFSFLGLAGVLLGPRAFVATAIAVLLHLLLFKHGGVSSLGVNIFNLGMGALVGWLVFSLHRYFLKGETGREKQAKRKIIVLFAGTAGALAGITKVGLGSTVLYLSGYPPGVAVTLFTVHIPVFVLEAAATGLVAGALVSTGREMLYQPQKKQQVPTAGDEQNQLVNGEVSAAKLR